MKGFASLLATFVLVVAVAAVPVAGTAGGASGAGHATQAETTTPANGSADGVAPGARFAGVVDVQEAEVEGELEDRTFGLRIARANTTDSKAAVVAENVDALTRRVEAIGDRKRSLDAARENGTISEGRYRAEVAAMTTRLAAIDRQLDRSETVSRDLPADVLESRGVNATAIATLRNESGSVAGPDAATIARSIGGPPSTGGLDEGGDRPGPPANVPGSGGTGADANDTGQPTGDDRPGRPPDVGNGTGIGDGSPTPSDSNVTAENATDSALDANAFDGSGGSIDGDQPSWREP